MPFIRKNGRVIHIKNKGEGAAPKVKRIIASSAKDAASSAAFSVVINHMIDKTLPPAKLARIGLRDAAIVGGIGLVGRSIATIYRAQTKKRGQK